LARKRFQTEVGSGRLEILNFGITDGRGEVEFWVSEKSVWSSFDSGAATREGRTATQIVVPTISFGEILERYREPLFVKIDIEGNDALCFRDMARSSIRPKHVSFEGNSTGVEDISLLASIGYDRFKCIRQNDFRELTPRNTWWQVQVQAVWVQLLDVDRELSCNGLGEWFDIHACRSLLPQQSVIRGTQPLP